MDHIPSPDWPKAAKTRAGDTRDRPGTTPDPGCTHSGCHVAQRFRQASLSGPSGCEDARQRQQRQHTAASIPEAWVIVRVTPVATTTT